MKKTKLIGATVVVAVDIPRQWPGTTDENYVRSIRRAADDIAASVRRHVDGHNGVHVELEHEHTCEHCGSHWTEDSKSYNGGCCAKDEEANDAELAKVSP